VHWATRFGVCITTDILASSSDGAVHGRHLDAVLIPRLIALTERYLQEQALSSLP
jgi:hypothetical protein